jgi:hypothetical protein
MIGTAVFSVFDVRFALLFLRCLRYPLSPTACSLCDYLEEQDHVTPFLNISDQSLIGETSNGVRGSTQVWKGVQLLTRDCGSWQCMWVLVAGFACVLSVDVVLMQWT